MDGPQQIVQQLQALWRSWSLRQRASLVVGTILCAAAVVGVGLWASQPEYVTLADQLTPGAAAEVVSALEAQAIEYRLNFAGSAVLVPQTDLSRARLCTKDVVVAAPEAAAAWGDSLWSDPSLNQARLLREQELRLTRTIQQLRAVNAATVHISRPQASPFVRERTPTKASVVLDLRSGEAFTAADSQGLVALLAHSVEGLDSEHVSIVDTSGRQLASVHGLQADIQGRLEFQQRLETSLAAKAEAVLTQVLGPGNAVVRVTAEVDFTETTRTETTYDPDGSVKVSEERETETNADGLKSAVGPPGTASNLTSVSGKAGASALSSKRESSKTQFENARVEDRLTEAPGRITRLTIAAVVHPPEPAAGQTAPVLNTADLESLIKQAVGFDSTRLDAVTVMKASTGVRPVAVPLELEPSAWPSHERLIRLASLGVGALAALLLGVLVLRRMRPVSLPPVPQESVSLDVAHRLAELSQVVRQQPELAAQVVANWLATESPPAVERRRAA